MDRKLTHQEEVDRAKLRLQLIAERAELQAAVARKNGTGLAGGAMRTFSQLQIPGKVWLGIGGAGLAALLGGVIIARQPKLRSVALLALVRFLSR